MPSSIIILALIEYKMLLQLFDVCSRISEIKTEEWLWSSSTHHSPVSKYGINFWFQTQYLTISIFVVFIDYIVSLIKL